MSSIRKNNNDTKLPSESYSVHLTYRQSRELGLKSDGAEVSSDAPIFNRLEEIRAAADALFAPGGAFDWRALDDATLNALIDFAKKQQCYQSRYVFDESILKAALTQNFRPGDAISSVQYSVRPMGGRGRSKKETVSLEEVNGNANWLTSYLVSKSNYPIDLHISRQGSLLSKYPNNDPLRFVRRLDLSNNVLVRGANWNDMANGFVKFTVLEELVLDKWHRIGRL